MTRVLEGAEEDHNADKRTKTHANTILQQSGPVLLTDEQLKGYDGSDASKPIYLALNGTIYDVSAGRHLYVSLPSLSTTTPSLNLTRQFQETNAD